MCFVKCYINSVKDNTYITGICLLNTCMCSHDIDVQSVADYMVREKSLAVREKSGISNGTF